MNPAGAEHPGCIDGRTITTTHRLQCDIVVVGSGPAGASVAWELALRGVDVLVVERGKWWKPGGFPEDGLGAMSELYDGMGARVTRGRAPMPYLQGIGVGGTSLINGAISWRLPHDIWEEWCTADRALRDALPWTDVEAACAEVEHNLGIAPTPAHVQGENDRLLKIGADALGLENRPIRRNTPSCQGSGRCLQGCPNGAKLTPDRTYLKWALERGARVLSAACVTRVVTDTSGTTRQCTGVEAQTNGKGRVSISARHGAVLAASAVGSPLLLLDSGIRHGPVGLHFQAHPGASVIGRFPHEVSVWSGSTQGHEVTGLRHEGLKFEALGFDAAVAGTRTRGFGEGFAAEFRELANLAHWGCAVRATARGRVRRGWLGDTIVSYQPNARDIATMKRGIAWLGRMMFAAGASWVDLGVHGAPARIESIDLIDPALEPVHDPRAFSSVITHMFGTTRMGSDPSTSVVAPDFQHHEVQGLWVADSSVFPSNTGVNPQTSIMALATLCGRNVARALGVADQRVETLAADHSAAGATRRLA